ncbi:MAG: DNA mismatch repair protein MutS [Anaerolineaceae bacterium]|nr:DNA mismatch repair protein MutS [Anaerolineaceae bacterium]
MSKSNVTPIRQQYLDIKNDYRDAILFFRLGDFYETFDEDAEIASRELDIVLTSRNVAKGVRIPMAGIPYHAAENYLSKLIEKGYHVAICEQIGEPPARGLVHREVVRVVTPGTIIEPGLLQSDQNNYLAAAFLDEDERKAGIAYVDISTGEFAATQFSGENILNLMRAELTRLNPAELLLPEESFDLNHTPGHKSNWASWHFELGRCTETLLRHFGAASLDGFGLQHLPLAVQAAGAVLQYIQNTQSAALELLTSLSAYQLHEFMTLDAVTRRNLELTETIRSGETRGSLLHVLDHTVTPMGKRMLKQWVSKPLLDIESIEKRQDGIQFMLENGLLRTELRQALKSLSDLERLTNRVVSGNAVPRDLVSLRETLQALPEVKALFTNAPTPLSDLLSQFSICEAERTLLEESITEEPPATLQNVGVINPSFSDELNTVMEASEHAREWIANLEQVERERTGIKTLKVGYNKVFGYYIEISRAQSGSAPEEYIRKQTLVNAERYITPEMKEYETLVLNAEEQIRGIENRIFKEVCKGIAQNSATLLESARVIAHLDVITSLAEAAALNNYIRPIVDESTALNIRDGRHPVVEHSLTNERFVPNDIHFEDGEIVRIITGPNMSGKSTFLRQTAILALMAQMGSFVPAAEARIGLVDRIFTRIGAQDEIHAGQSTFMVEMIESANILHNATNRSLLILDEIGRGTSTYDGVSIAWAIIEYVHNHPTLRARTLFATHYHELTQLSEILPGVRNYNVAVSEADGHPVFLHKIVAGAADRSYGVHVGQLAGLPRPVIQRASEILEQLESSSGKAVRIDAHAAHQLALFPETNPLLDELRELDINTLSPIEALNKLYEWQRKFNQ